MRFLLLIGLICVGWYFWGIKERYLSHAISEQLGFKVTIQEASLEKLDTLVFRHVTCYDHRDMAALRFRKAKVKLSLRHALDDPLILSSVHLERPELYIHIQDKLQHNWSTWLSQPHPSSKHLIIDDLIITEGFAQIHRGQKSSVKAPVESVILQDVGGTSGLPVSEITQDILAQLLKSTGYYKEDKKNKKFAPLTQDCLEEWQDMRGHLFHVF
jgi:hypothetical protein